MGARRLLHRESPLRFGLRKDQIGQRLRFDQIELAVDEGTPREFSGLGKPHAFMDCARAKVADLISVLAPQAADA